MNPLVTPGLVDPTEANRVSLFENQINLERKRRPTEDFSDQDETFDEGIDLKGDLTKS